MDVVSASLEEASHVSMPTTPKMKVSYWLISLLRILFITKHVFGFGVWFISIPQIPWKLNIQIHIGAYLHFSFKFVLDA
jgi:hypothetical protein